MYPTGGERRDAERLAQRVGLVVDPARLMVYSRLLVEPEVQYEFLVNGETVTVTNVELRGEGSREELKRLLGRLSLIAGLEGVFYASMVGEVANVKALVANGRLIGLVANVEGEEYIGAAAVEALGKLRDRMTLTIIRVRTRVAEWKPEYSVYIRSMDEQHKRFFELLNRLYESLVAGRIEEEGDVILRGLEGYTRAHFRSEEKVLEHHGYPAEWLEEHRREHKVFARVVQDYRERYETDPASLGMSIFYVVRNWFADHILVTDRKYGRYFRERGVRVE